jgi:hypothetical protein
MSLIFYFDSPVSILSFMAPEASDKFYGAASADFFLQNGVAGADFFAK